MTIVQPAKLRQGLGDGRPEDGLCLMQMVDWFSGREHVTDNPACACPVLTAIGVRLNDNAPTQADRDSLWPLVWRLLGSRDQSAQTIRAEHIVREVTHRIIAPVFEPQWPDHARALRAARSMREIEQAARAADADAARAAAYAARAADAATNVQWPVLRDIFVEAINLGAQGEEDPVYAPRAKALADLLSAQ